MALKPVSDPNLLAALGASTLPAVPQPKAPVQDPALLAQLNAPEQPAAPALGGVPTDTPGSPEAKAADAAAAQPEPSIWEKFKNAITPDDPVLSMLGHGLSTIVQGAPEVAAGAVNNMAAQGVAGLTGSFISDPNDSANFMRDFIEQNSHEPQGENAKALSAGLGEAFGEPVANAKRALGETTLAATGSPLAATGADMIPDLAATIFGGPKAGAGEIAEAPVAGGSVRFRQPERAPDLTAAGADMTGGGVKPQAQPINPKVSDLRAADIRLRPSDVRAVTPGAKKVPGEFRERFADAPDLKKDLTLHNQQKLTDIAAKDIGVKDLTRGSLDEAAKAPAATYDQVEQIAHSGTWKDANAATLREALDSVKLERPRGETPTVVNTIGALRRRASKRINSNNVESEQAGYADRNMAEALEDALGDELKARGEPQLLKEYQDARQQFAKINDVSDSVRADHIDAAALKRINDKMGGDRLTGGLKLVADASEYAPNVTKHSTTTAARAGGEIEGSKEGLFKAGVKKVIRSIPGMDVGSEGFQRTLGAPDEARTSYYGRKNEVAPARGPEQQGLDLREALDLQAPPGEIGKPARPQRDFGPQVDALGNAFEFNMPPGEVGIPPEAPISLQDILGLGEPLNLKNAPGRVGKPKRKP